MDTFALFLIVITIGSATSGLVAVSNSINRLSESLASDSRKVQSLLTDIRDRLGKAEEGKDKE